MTTGNSPQDDADLAAFLARQSSVSTDYANLELVEPPSTLDDKILAVAKAAAKSAPKAALKAVATPDAGNPAPARPTGAGASSSGASSAMPTDPAERRKRPRVPPATPEEDDPIPARRPVWLVPAALAAIVVVAVGLTTVLMQAPSDTSEATSDGFLFAKRARERSEEDKAAAAAAAEQEAEVAELEMAPLPPPPIFEAEGPQVQDLDAAIALIRKDLVLANQAAAIKAEGTPGSTDREIATGSAARLADAAAPAVPAAPDAPSVVQPRERRLTKILELYDRGDPDLAGDSLEIFLRDFEDDPISQRILGAKP